MITLGTFLQFQELQRLLSLALELDFIYTYHVLRSPVTSAIASLLISFRNHVSAFAEHVRLLTIKFPLASLHARPARLREYVHFFPFLSEQICIPNDLLVSTPLVMLHMWV